MKSPIHVLAALTFAAFLSGCASTPTLDNSGGRKTMYQDVTAPSATVSGVGIESQDIASMTDKMVRDILSNPDIAGRVTPPRIVIDSAYFTNESSSRINKNLITERLRGELNRAARGRLIFIAQHYGDMVDKAREAKRNGQTDGGTIRATKAQGAPDFRLGGRIMSSDAVSATNGNVSRYHMITFELIDQELGAIPWSGMYEFKKEARDDVLYR
jgi:PBP1b-binding outer membrane lipoprotein LpoB